MSNFDAVFPWARPWVVGHVWKVTGIGFGACFALGVFTGWMM